MFGSVHDYNQYVLSFELMKFTSMLRNMHDDK